MPKHLNLKKLFYTISHVYPMIPSPKLWPKLRLWPFERQPWNEPAADLIGLFRNRVVAEPVWQNVYIQVTDEYKQNSKIMVNKSNRELLLTRYKIERLGSEILQSLRFVQISLHVCTVPRHHLIH